ncbi:Universal stress protein [uncultured archaeon]|nr:Universal stress protein [uncultured archaeon]
MTNLFKKILIATDGSEHVKKAVTFAIELAKLYGAELHAVYVTNIKVDHARSLYTDRSTGGLKRILRKEGTGTDIYRKEGETATNYVKDLAKKEGLETKKWVVEGHPAEEILKLAQEQSIDLIVMGTLGRSGIEKFLLGSVADKVIRNSGIPVLAVRK